MYKPFFSRAFVRRGRLSTAKAMAMNRELIAFLIAAVAVPIFLTAVSFGGMPKSPSGAIFLAASFFVSFCAVFLLGLPTCYFLQDKKWTAFWIAPLAGFAVAAAAWYALTVLLGMVFASDRLSVLIDISLLQGALWPIGPVGAVVGVLVWLIARPDRTDG